MKYMSFLTGKKTFITTPTQALGNLVLKAWRTLLPWLYKMGHK